MKLPMLVGVVIGINFCFAMQVPSLTRLAAEVVKKRDSIPLSAKPVADYLAFENECASDPARILGQVIERKYECSDESAANKYNADMNYVIKKACTKVKSNQFSDNAYGPLFIRIIQQNDIPLFKKIIHLFAAHGKTLKINDICGKNALHHATSAEAIDLLVSLGAEINAKNEWNETPLEKNVKYAKLSIAEILISYGADVTLLPSIMKNYSYLREDATKTNSFLNKQRINAIVINDYEHDHQPPPLIV